MRSDLEPPLLSFSPEPAIATVPAGTITYEDTTLSSNTTYYWVISAYDTSDNESNFSNEVSKSIF